MTTNVERAGVVSRHVQIELVTLTDMKMKTSLHELDQPSELRVGYWFRCRHELRPSDPDRVFVYVELKCEASPGGEARVESGALVDLTATLLVTYRLEGAHAYPRDALQQFADLNGTYNAWPYWRELVQSMTTRAGLSGITAPVFRPKVRQIPTQEELTLTENIVSPALPSP